MSTVRLAGLAIVATLVLAACGDDGTAPVGPPASVAGVSGNNQSAVVGQALPAPITVRVTDADGRAVSGADVVFAVTVGGGDVAAAVAPGLAADGSGSLTAFAVTVTTDAQGEAQATWTLGTTAGQQAASATVTGVAPFTFTATGQPDVADAVALASGDGQEGLLGQDLAAPFVVNVTDQHGNDVPGETVDWAVTQGDASFSAATSTTDASGQGANTLTLGQTAEEIAATATVGSIAPVTFTALAKAETADPAGDEFSTGASAGLVPPDVTRITAWRQGTDLMIEIEFVDNVVSDDTGGPNVVIGFVDIDTDQNAGTGVTANTDTFRPGPGSTGMGMDFFVNLFMGGSGVYSVVETGGFTTVGTITPSFNANVLSMSIPLAMLGGDDGIVDLATVVGTLPEPTDIAPENGSLSTGPPPGPAAASVAPDTRSDRLRVWRFAPER